MACGSDRVATARTVGQTLAFAAWVWVTNILTNAFESSGRYMILHYSQIDDKGLVDTLIGNYHAAQLVPNLIINMASMLGGTLFHTYRVIGKG